MAPWVHVCAVLIDANKVRFWPFCCCCCVSLQISGFSCSQLYCSNGPCLLHTLLVEWPPSGSQPSSSKVAVLLLRMRGPLCPEGLPHSVINNRERMPSANDWCSLDAQSSQLQCPQIASWVFASYTDLSVQVSCQSLKTVKYQTRDQVNKIVVVSVQRRMCTHVHTPHLVIIKLVSVVKMSSCTSVKITHAHCKLTHAVSCRC